LIGDRRFDTGDAVIPWLAVGLVLYCMQQIVEYQAILLRKTNRLIVVHFSAALTNVLTNIALGRWLGVSAPAVATFLTYLLMFGVTVYVCRPVISTQSWLKVLALITAACALVLLCRLITVAGAPIALRAVLRWTLFLGAYGVVAWRVIGPLYRTELAAQSA
jgi:O-antigen/teichoic acid export membrane protein